MAIAPRHGSEHGEDWFRLLAESSAVGIYRASAEGACTYVNRKWCEIAGLSPSEALGTGWQASVHPEDRSAVVSQ